ncbi:hypothetical protein QYF61_019487, partial [Mycteria americana]
MVGLNDLKVCQEVFLTIETVPVQSTPDFSSMLHSSFAYGIQNKYRKAAIKCPQSLPFSRLTNPNSLSLSSQERCSIPLIIFVALLWTHSKRSMSFLYWGPNSWMQLSRSQLENMCFSVLVYTNIRSFALRLRDNWLLNFSLDQPGQTEPGSGLEAGQTAPRAWAGALGRLTALGFEGLTDVRVLVMKRVWGQAGRGCLLGNPCPGELERRASTCCRGGDVCASAVGVCVGAGDGTASRADLCSRTCVHSVRLPSGSRPVAPQPCGPAPRPALKRVAVAERAAEALPQPSRDWNKHNS